MPRLYLVRHGRATGGFGDALDPGLDALGAQQAEAMADVLAPLGPLPMMTSPLRRARETVAALERRWNTVALVDSGVGEVPAPDEDLTAREAWIRQAMGKTWTELGPRYTSWRTMVTELLLRTKVDTVVVSHFVAINAVIGHATGDDRVMCAALGNGSVTTVDCDVHSFDVVEIGEQDATVVQ
jgi:broad specificity phosphatase PhoE